LNQENPKNKLLNILILWRKESSLNRKSTNQKITNNKSILQLLTYIVRLLWTLIDLKFYLNIEKYIKRLMVKFQPNLMVGLRVMLNNIKLDSKHNYARIWIFLFNIFLDHIKVVGLYLLCWENCLCKKNWVSNITSESKWNWVV
jgi:hypothetical protein